MRIVPVKSQGYIFSVYDDLHPNGSSVFSFMDESEVRERWWHPKQDDVVLDIGAGFGSYTLPACAMGARVYAWSPEHDGEILTQNVALNHWEDRCTVYRYGFYSQHGWVNAERKLFSPNHQWSHGWFFVGVLDGFVFGEQLPRVDWIKIDVEGAEVNVLQGGRETILTFHPNILVENHNFLNPTLEQQVIDFMSGLDIPYGHATMPYAQISHTFFQPL